MPISQVLGASPEILFIGTYAHVIDFKVVQEMQDYVAGALKNENIQVIYNPIPILRGAELIKSGSLDGEVPSTKENMRYFSRSVVYLKNPLIFSNFKVVYLKTNKKYSFENLPKLRGAIILNNSTLQDVIQKKSLQVIEVSSVEQAFLALEKKRVDYLILSEGIARGFLLRSPLNERLFDIDSHVVEQVPLYFALSNRKSSLMPRIEKAMRQASHEDLQRYPLIKNLINKDF